MSPQCHGTLWLLDFDKRFWEFWEFCHFDNMSPQGHANYKLKNRTVKPWLNLCELVMG
jgi:hypothetical protein